MSRNDSLCKLITDQCVVRGNFLLRCGLRTNVYFDKYKIISDPVILGGVVSRMKHFIPAKTQVIAGLEVGSIPVATLLSTLLHIPLAIVRKEPKKYGTGRQVEGADVWEKTVFIVEDVATSGGSIHEATRVLRSYGAIVESAGCIINREEGAVPALQQAGVYLRSVFTRSELRKFDETI
jgi:orotate phosphoribosyltransferase